MCCYNYPPFVCFDIVQDLLLPHIRKKQTAVEEDNTEIRKESRFFFEHIYARIFPPFLKDEEARMYSLCCENPIKTHFIKGVNDAIFVSILFSR